MTYETEIQEANDGDVWAAWVVYLVVIFGLVGCSLVRVFT